jgi:hypothetical protein
MRTGARRVGYEYVHVCVDDATRLAYVEVLPDERATTAISFLRRCLGFFAARGVHVERIMTDNGSAYRSATWALATRALGIRHLRTRPRRPRTNGKAERFIRTMLNGWAYGAIYATSHERARGLPGWLDYYNHQRPHGSLAHQPPGHRLRALQADNVPGNYNESFAPLKRVSDCTWRSHSVIPGDSGFLHARTPLGRPIAACEVGGELCLLGQIDGHFQHSKRDPLLEPVLINTPRRRRGWRRALHGAPLGVERVIPGRYTRGCHDAQSPTRVILRGDWPSAARLAAHRTHPQLACPWRAVGRIAPPPPGRFQARRWQGDQTREQCPAG